MIEPSLPQALTPAYGSLLSSVKADFVRDGDTTSIAQHGMARIDSHGFPGWPGGLTSDGPVIETFLGQPSGVQSLSDNEPFISAWTPLAAWMNTTVRAALSDNGVEVEGDAFITASLTDSSALEGLAHMDDDVFVPGDTVGVVAILGQHCGPRAATGSLAHTPLRPMGQVTFDDALRLDFETNALEHCAGAPDELVVFPQFGQLHAGPAARHITEPTRQLLVFRSRG